MDFDVEVTEHGGRTVIATQGDLDVLTAAQVRDRLVEVIDSGQTDIMVDLRQTEFVDSSGLSALVTAVKRVRALGGDIVLVCPGGNVRRILEIVALDQVFKIQDSV